jgi:phosphatidate cytidylyltransferase
VAKAGTGEIGRRVLSSLVLAPGALAAAYFGGPAFAVVTALAGAGVVFEWCRMASSRTIAPVTILGVVTVGGAVATTLLLGPWAGAAVAVGGALAVLGAAYRFGAPSIWSACGVLYPSAACIALLSLRLEPESGRALVFWLFLIVWASDIGAYALGRAVGGTRLAPRISPGKTVSGAIGGVISALLIAWLAGIALSALGWLSEPPPLALSLPVAFAVALGAQGGDLIESAIKRRFKVKDSGELIPGHGGLFDRLDSLLAASLVLGLIRTLFGDPLAAGP